MALKLRAEARVSVPAPPAVVWPFVADTDRVNRALGQPPVDVSPASEEARRRGVLFVGRTALAGVPVVYEEHPFAFVAEREFSVRRVLLEGPLEELHYELRLEPEGATTAVTVALTLVPIDDALAPLLEAAAAEAVGKHRAFLTALADDLAAGRPVEEPASAVEAHARDRGTTALLEEIARVGGDPAAATAVARFLAEAPDSAVTKIRPFDLAATLGLSREATLTALLAAVPAGLAELRWAIICPSCQAPTGTFPTLADFAPPGHCALCDLSFAVPLDEAVEAIFRPHPALRTVEARPFCLAGPGRLPHVVAQGTAPPGGELLLPVAAAVGRFRLFARGGAVIPVTVTEDGPAQVTATFSAAEPAPITVRAGGLVAVRNEGDDARPMKLERLGFASHAATAHAVSLHPAFGRLLGRELLRPGAPLVVSRVALLFSDLVGSTALYAAVGDAAAFGLVADHFELLTGVVTAAGGVVVKTMGDAIMAAFPDEAAATRAASEALAAFEAFAARHTHGAAVGLKLGGVAGPCYAVQANDRLDYFGQTVNVAARLQGLAGPGEHVMLASAWEGLPERAGLVVASRREVRVKGVSHPLAVVHLRRESSADARAAT